MRIFGAAERIGDDRVVRALDGCELLDGDAKNRVLRFVEVLFLQGGDGRLDGFRDKRVLFGGPICKERLVAIAAGVLDVARGDFVDGVNIFSGAIEIGLDVRRAWARDDRYDQFLHASVHEVVDTGQLAHRNKARVVKAGDVAI